MKEERKWSFPIPEVTPQLFHIVRNDKIFCGLAEVDCVHSSSPFCSRCNLDWTQANKRLAEAHLLKYEGRSMSELSEINEILKKNRSFQRGLLVARTS